MSKSYELKVPGKVISGVGSIQRLTEITDSLKVKSVTILTDKGVFYSGGVEYPLRLLEENGILVNVISDIPAEPEDNQVRTIYNNVKEFNSEMIVAIGGGSVMDTAKMVAVMATNPDYYNNLIDNKLIVNRGIPVIMVPTSAGTGSEATPNSIVVVPELSLKVGVVHEYFLPQYVILDANLTKSLPKPVTAATGLDALCHAIETLISKKSNPFCEVFSLKAIRLISDNLEKVYENGEDIEARENMLLAAFYGGLCISSSSTVGIHALSYPLGGTYRIPHGISNAILLPYVMEFNMDSISDKIWSIADAMGIDTDGVSINDVEGMLISRLFKMVEIVGIPNNLTSFGVKKEDIDSLTDAAFEVKRLLDNNPKVMTKDDIRAIYGKLLN